VRRNPGGRAAEASAVDDDLRSPPRSHPNTTDQQNTGDTNNARSKRKTAGDGRNTSGEAIKVEGEVENPKKPRHSANKDAPKVPPTVTDLCGDEEDNRGPPVTTKPAETERRLIEKAVLAEESRPMDV
jgi:hypothetical protein